MRDALEVHHRGRRGDGGVEFCVAFVINPILDGLPGDSGLRGRAHGGRMLGAVMPVWYIGPRRRHHRRRALLAAART
jgi:hypothetical protein